MRTAGALMYAALVAAAFASGFDRTQTVWFVLVVAFVALFMASLFRLIAVLNAPKEQP
ncbi:hypothetical protein [Curtobacterium sp. 'Ferrero']|uniref:hypothetical protein n=1 Tax=Curtobacterium sp. 'Ferrero' TaxID=2033654 RepID=UPI001596F6EC|nr:hypothetical protein [Curtobacterium sp. 'Ferrero']